MSLMDYSFMDDRRITQLYTLSRRVSDRSTDPLAPMTLLSIISHRLLGQQFKYGYTAIFWSPYELISRVHRLQAKLAINQKNWDKVPTLPQSVTCSSI